jgi:alpha-1,2-mannosyltransferase
VTEYDDGPYFGSAVRLTQGILPYRDFVLVQPPGITLLMLPAAVLAKVTGTATGTAAGRVRTALAGVAAVPVMGRLVRHRGAFATLVACGVLAVFPDSVAAAHTVLVEPWLALAANHDPEDLGLCQQSFLYL